MFIIFSYSRGRQWWPKFGESLRPRSSPTGSRTFHRQIFTRISRLYAHFLGIVLLKFFFEISISRVFWRSLFSDLISDVFLYIFLSG